MEYKKYRTTSKWTKGFWDPSLTPLSLAESISQCDVYENYLQDSNRTYSFDFFDSDSFVANSLWQDKKINYTFNAHGYRGPSFNSNKKIKIITIGCSHTFGTGIDDSSTWAEQLKQLIMQYDTDDVEVFNLGTPGVSTDSNTVQLYQLINIIKPNIVFWMPPNWRRYDIGKESHTLLDSGDVFEVSQDQFEHETLTVFPAILDSDEMSKDKNIFNYSLYGSLDVQTRYQNFSRNFSIVRDMCEYNNIKLFSFTNFHQFRCLFEQIIKMHTDDLDNVIQDLEYFSSYTYPNTASHFCNDHLSQEDALLDYYLMNSYKNIIAYNSLRLKQTMVCFYKDVNKGVYNEYLDGIGNDSMHPKLLARDNAHNGHFFNTSLAKISYGIVKEDIAKLLNT